MRTVSTRPGRPSHRPAAPRRPRLRAATAALALLGAISAVRAAQIHDVTQVGTDFVPATLTVAPGDTIRWTWTSGNHTVTTGAGCVYDGVYFDEPLTAANPLVEFTVPANLAGDVPYFCDPHCSAGMIGTFTVVAPCPADFDESGAVDVTDLLNLLGAWGPCPAPCASDLDGSGTVDVTDLLALLGAWGACP